MKEIQTTKKVVASVIATLELQAEYLRANHTIPNKYEVWGTYPDDQKAEKEYMKIQVALKEIRKVFK